MRKATLLLFVLGLTGSLWAGDPLLGIWNLSLDKSSYGTLPWPKSITRIFTAPQEDEIHFIVDEVSGDGKSFLINWTGKCDGKDYPATGATDYDSAAVKRLSDGSLEWVFKKGGKIFADATSVISRDGKTLTMLWRGKNPAGEELVVLHVYSKQQPNQRMPAK